ncbi:3-oxoacyl-[acyl-carrier-protein] reductase FabG-like [Salvia divinorum]|uniref:3-oxoacyl-[acyl-carrier-protein] reductase FabG-like n=1 Tax=Salvia divinorum TaxID=28513 RepID=A0ABD1HE96_SALDI
MAAKFQHQLEPWAQLPDKIVMVTGASSGLGLEFCLDLAASGCRIVAAARRIDRLESLCHQINKMDGLIAKAVELNVTEDGPIIEAAVEKAWCERAQEIITGAFRGGLEQCGENKLEWVMNGLQARDHPTPA